MDVFALLIVLYQVVDVLLDELVDLLVDGRSIPK